MKESEITPITDAGPVVTGAVTCCNTCWWVLGSTEPTLAGIVCLSPHALVANGRERPTGGNSVVVGLQGLTGGQCSSSLVPFKNGVLANGHTVKSQEQAEELPALFSWDLSWVTSRLPLQECQLRSW